MVELKSRNPGFKPMLGLGGAGAGYEIFSKVIFQEFLKKKINVILNYNECRWPMILQEGQFSSKTLSTFCTCTISRGWSLTGFRPDILKTWYT